LIDSVYLVHPEIVSQVLDQIVSSHSAQLPAHRCSAITVSSPESSPSLGFHSPRPFGHSKESISAPQGLATLAGAWARGLSGAAAQQATAPVKCAAGMTTAHQRVLACGRLAPTEGSPMPSKRCEPRHHIPVVCQSVPPGNDIGCPDGLSLGSGWPALASPGSHCRSWSGDSPPPLTSVEGL
jgi:hypothetical protein